VLDPTLIGGRRRQHIADELGHAAVAGALEESIDSERHGTPVGVTGPGGSGAQIDANGQQLRDPWSAAGHASGR
jgi:hypothetical protein